MRVTLNDIADTTILAGTSFDVNSNEIFSILEAETRIGNNWRGEIRAKILSNSQYDSFSAGLKSDNHFTFRLARYF